MSPTKAFSDKNYFPVGTFSRTCHHTLEHGAVAGFPVWTAALRSIVLDVTIVCAVAVLLLFFVLSPSLMQSSHCAFVALVLLTAPVSTSCAADAFTLFPSDTGHLTWTWGAGRAASIPPVRLVVSFADMSNKTLRSRAMEVHNMLLAMNLSRKIDGRWKIAHNFYPEMRNALLRRA